jgi:hypothetical protein
MAYLTSLRWSRTDGCRKRGAATAVAVLRPACGLSYCLPAACKEHHHPSGEGWGWFPVTRGEKCV